MIIILYRRSTNSKLKGSFVKIGEPDILCVQVNSIDINIDNYDFTFTVKRSLPDPQENAIIVKASSGGGINKVLINKSNLEVEIPFTIQESELIEDGQDLFYCVEMTTHSPVSNRIINRGTFVVKRGE